MSKFQIILLVIFGFFTVAAVLVFALFRGGGSREVQVTIWGPFSAQEFSLFYNDSGLSSDSLLRISYVEKSPASIEAEFTEALARGESPDLIILRQDQLEKNKPKLLPIPYGSLSQRDFQETFVEAGDIYLGRDGVYGLPLVIDPMILYYNRDSLSAAGVAKPLAYWDEIYAATKDLSKRDAAGNLVKSTIALGETKNIANAKDIFSLLLLQAGTSITAWNGVEYYSTLAEANGLPVIPAEASLEFYTQFSNPTKAFYSWNRALPEAQNRFASGDLAYYLGFASEYRMLKGKNPLLNFAVSPVPQSRVSGKAVTVGRTYGLSISRGTKNSGAAFTAITRLVAPEVVSKLSATFALPPARRDILSLKPSDSVWPVLYGAALQTKSWIDPDATETAKIFYDMIESVTSGRERVSQAVAKGSEELTKLLRQQ